MGKGLEWKGWREMDKLLMVKGWRRRMEVFFFSLFGLFFWGIDMEEGKVKIRVYEEEEREDQL